MPESVAVAVVGAVAPLLRADALFADTLSVKTRIAAEVTRELRGCAAVSLNPMFAPALGLAGRVVAAVTLADGPPVAAFLGLLRGAGATIVEVTADEHDRITAVSQAATHAAVIAFGLAAAGLGVDIRTLRALAPPPHETMLALLARIVSGTADVYWEVQQGNPMAEAARQALRTGMDRLAAGAGEHDFAALLGEIREFLGETDRTELAGRCQEIFSLMADHGLPRSTP